MLDFSLVNGGDKMLSAWTGWLGLILTAVFGVANVWQWIKNWHERSKWNSARVQLEQIRAMCTEAIEKGEAINTEPARQFVRSVAHMIRGVERGLQGK